MFPLISPDAKLSHDLLRTPADTGAIPSIGTAFALGVYLGSFLNQVVAVILTKAASRSCAVPEEAPTAILLPRKEKSSRSYIRGFLYPALEQFVASREKIR